MNPGASETVFKAKAEEAKQPAPAGLYAKLMAPGLRALIAECNPREGFLLDA